MNGREAPEAARTLAALLPRLADIMPSWCWWDVDLDKVWMQAETQAKVRELMALFPGVVWQKEYRKYESWWVYQTEYAGVKLHIYAIREAPPTCRVEYKKVEAEEQVPVAYETRTVKKRVAVITCDNEEATTMNVPISGVLVESKGVRYYIMFPSGAIYWERFVRFGRDRRHRAGGAAFAEAAKLQAHAFRELFREATP